MNETSLNTCIQDSFKRLWWSKKIPDPQAGRGVQLPFDGIATANGLPFYWEAKIQKEYKAFNLSRVEDHQWENLLTIDKQLIVSHYTLIILGVWISRKSFRVFFFDTNYLWELKQRGIKSIKKNELLDLVDSSSFLEIKSEKCYNGSRKLYIQNLEELDKVIIGRGEDG